MNMEELLKLLKERKENFRPWLSHAKENRRASAMHRIHEIDLIVDAIQGGEALKKLMKETNKKEKT